MSNWDEYRARKAAAEAGGNYRKWLGGKGDVDRSTHLDTYQLGSKLMKIAEEKGKDSEEYKETYELWKAAVRRASGIKDN